MQGVDQAAGRPRRPVQELDGEAAAAGRRGETVLLALLVLGGSVLDESGPALLSEVVIGLRKVGLETEARRLAIEAALAAGLRSALTEILQPVEQPLVITEVDSPFVILVVGVNGAGKRLEEAGRNARDPPPGFRVQ